MHMVMNVRYLVLRMSLFLRLMQDAVPDLSALAQDFMQKHVPLFTAPWRVKLDLEAAGCSASLVSPATVRCSQASVQSRSVSCFTPYEPLVAGHCCAFSPTLCC